MSNQETQKNTQVVDGEQSFKEGMKNLVIQALDGGGAIAYKDCNVVLDNGSTIKFELVINVKEIETTNKELIDQVTSA